MYTCMHRLYMYNNASLVTRTSAYIFFLFYFENLATPKPDNCTGRVPFFLFQTHALKKKAITKNDEW